MALCSLSSGQVPGHSPCQPSLAILLHIAHEPTNMTISKSSKWTFIHWLPTAEDKDLALTPVSSSPLFSSPPPLLPSQQLLSASSVLCDYADWFTFCLSSPVPVSSAEGAVLILAYPVYISGNWSLLNGIKLKAICQCEAWWGAICRQPSVPRHSWLTPSELVWQEQLGNAETACHQK